MTEYICPKCGHILAKLSQKQYLCRSCVIEYSRIRRKDCTLYNAYFLKENGVRKIMDREIAMPEVRHA